MVSDCIEYKIDESVAGRHLRAVELTSGRYIFIRNDAQNLYWTAMYKK